MSKNLNMENQRKLTIDEKFNSLPQHLKLRMATQLKDYLVYKWLFEKAVEDCYNISIGNIKGKAC